MRKTKMSNVSWILLLLLVVMLAAYIVYMVIRTAAKLIFGSFLLKDAMWETYQSKNSEKNQENTTVKEFFEYWDKIEKRVEKIAE